MKLAVNQVTESPRDIRFQEGVDELNRTCATDPRSDFRFLAPIEVELSYYRSGRDIFFHGVLTGTVEGCCSRCLKSYPSSIEKRFDFVLTPELPPAKSRGLNRGELGLGFYSSDEIDLSPYIREEAILILAMRPLCDSECRGLCSGCGVDLNMESCRCTFKSDDPRLAVLRGLRLER